MLFSEVLASLQREGDVFVARIGEDWLQGRSLFGGLQAALAAEAMRAVLAAPIPLRTLQITFFAPVPAGVVRLAARVLRTGKNAVHAEARVFEGDQTLGLFVGVFGKRRDSVVHVAPARPPVDDARPIDFRHIRGVTPSFLQHYSMRWLRGHPPFTGHPDIEHVTELGCDEDGAASALHVIALADVIAPIGLSWLKQPAAGSSLTWMLDFLREDYAHLGLKNWRMDATLTAAVEGYTSQSGILWGPDGQGAALSRQSMVVFA